MYFKHPEGVMSLREGLCRSRGQMAYARAPLEGRWLPPRAARATGPSEAEMRARGNGSGKMGAVGAAAFPVPGAASGRSALMTAALARISESPRGFSDSAGSRSRARHHAYWC